MNDRLTPRFLVGAAVLATAVFCMAGPAPAEDFYAGKTLHLYIGFGPGGGYDRYGRLFARHLGRHIPATRPLSRKTCPALAG